MSGRGEASSFQSPPPVPGLSVLWIEAGRNARKVRIILCFWPHVWSGGIPGLILVLWVAGGLHWCGLVSRKSDCYFQPHVGPSRCRAYPETRPLLAASTLSSLFAKGLPHLAATRQHCLLSSPRSALANWEQLEKRQSRSDGCRIWGGDGLRVRASLCRFRLHSVS